MTKREKAVGILCLGALLIATLCAGTFLLFDFALPLLGRAWRTMTPDGKLALIEACVIYAGIGALLFYGCVRTKRLRDALALAITAAIIMPQFALGYWQVSDVWRSLFRAVLCW